MLVFVMWSWAVVGGKANEVERDRSKTFVCHTEEFGLYSESSEEPWLDFH